MVYFILCRLNLLFKFFDTNVSLKNGEKWRCLTNKFTNILDVHVQSVMTYSKTCRQFEGLPVSNLYG